MASLTYNSNPQLKASNVPVQYTQEQVEEYIKCKNDPAYFIDTYCYIIHVDFGIIPFKLYDCQKNKIKVIHENRKVVLMEGRQQGKCVEKETKYNIRNKITGEVLNVTAEEFHKLCNKN
jgi:hypothetical protein